MNIGGILKLAYKLLVNDKGKFAALLVGITFAAFLMVQMTSMFSGVLLRSSATVTNVGASMWVMDPAVQTVANSIPMPDYLLDAVRSIDGVRYASPLYSAGALVKLKSGKYQAVSVLGLDDTSLVGRPALEQGNIDDIYADNAFIVLHDAEYDKLENPAIGTEFELNDNRGVIVGVAKVASSGLFGVPTLAVDDKLFWGFDGLPMLRGWLEEDPWFRSGIWETAAALPAGTTRLAGPPAAAQNS